MSAAEWVPFDAICDIDDCPELARWTQTRDDADNPRLLPHPPPQTGYGRPARLPQEHPMTERSTDEIRADLAKVRHVVRGDGMLPDFWRCTDRLNGPCASVHERGWPRRRSRVRVWAATMSNDALEALRSLEKDTTPGPWRADTEHSPVSPKILSACMIRADNEWPGPAMTRQLRDAAFIVAAVEYVRAALAAAADAPQPTDDAAYFFDDGGFRATEPHVTETFRQTIAGREQLGWECATCGRHQFVVAGPGMGKEVPAADLALLERLAAEHVRETCPGPSPAVLPPEATE